MIFSKILIGQLVPWPLNFKPQINGKLPEYPFQCFVMVIVFKPDPEVDLGKSRVRSVDPDQPKFLILLNNKNDIILKKVKKNNEKKYMAFDWVFLA